MMDKDTGISRIRNMNSRIECRTRTRRCDHESSMHRQRFGALVVVIGVASIAHVVGASLSPTQSPTTSPTRSPTTETRSIPDYLIGVALSFLGSTGDSLGLIFQKLSHDREKAAAALEDRIQKNCLVRPAWWFGFTIYMVGNVLNLVALAFCGQTVNVLVGCWALCVNLYASPKLLGETRSWVDYAALGCMVSGILLSVGVAPIPPTGWGAAKLLLRFTSVGVITLLVVLVCIVIGTFVSTRLYLKAHPQQLEGAHTESHSPKRSPSTSLSQPTTTITSSDYENNNDIDDDYGKNINNGNVVVVVDDVDDSDGYNDDNDTNNNDADNNAVVGEDGGDDEGEGATFPTYQRVFHVLLAAATAVLTVSSATATIKTIRQVAAGKEPFSVLGGVLLILMLVTAVGQVYFINFSLKVNNGLFHIPVFVVFYIIGAEISAGTVYETFAGYPGWRWFVFLLGNACMIGGVVLSSHRLAALEDAIREHPGDDDHDDLAAPGVGDNNDWLRRASFVVTKPPLVRHASAAAAYVPLPRTNPFLHLVDDDPSEQHQTRRRFTDVQPRRRLVTSQPRARAHTRSERSSNAQPLNEPLLLPSSHEV